MRRWNVTGSGLCKGGQPPPAVRHPPRRAYLSSALGPLLGLTSNVCRRISALQNNLKPESKDGWRSLCSWRYAVLTPGVIGSGRASPFRVFTWAPLLPIALATNQGVHQAAQASREGWVSKGVSQGALSCERSSEGVRSLDLPAAKSRARGPPEAPKREGILPAACRLPPALQGGSILLRFDSH